MATKVDERSYEDALSWLREHGFDLLEAPGSTPRVFLKKYGVSAAIQKDGEDGNFQAGEQGLPAISEDSQE